MTKKIVVYCFVLIAILFLYLKFMPKKENENLISNEDETYNSNLLENIKYIAKDADGNEYTIIAEKGEIDLNNSDVIFLQNVNPDLTANCTCSLGFITGFITS